MASRRIYILSSIGGVGYDEAEPEWQEVEIERITIAVIGRKHLIKNKRATGPPRDQADVARLEGDQS